MNHFAGQAKHRAQTDPVSPTWMRKQRERTEVREEVPWPRLAEEDHEQRRARSQSCARPDTCRPPRAIGSRSAIRGPAPSADMTGRKAPTDGGEEREDLEGVAREGDTGGSSTACPRGGKVAPEPNHKRGPRSEEQGIRGRKDNAPETRGEPQTRPAGFAGATPGGIGKSGRSCAAFTPRRQIGDYVAANPLQNAFEPV